jgi:hypothetical protein
MLHTWDIVFVHISTQPSKIFYLYRRVCFGSRNAKGQGRCEGMSIGGGWGGVERRIAE